jgi:alpha-beta hydrolase superfamily lysophospholipase
VGSLFLIIIPSGTSIVAVHGLNGDWEKTWTDHNTKKLWLRDFLPRQFPNARVWSFGYDASVLSKSVADIDDAAIYLVDALDGERHSPASKTKPIIFVAHSLGGVIVKRVCYHACCHTLAPLKGLRKLPN